MEGVDFIEYSRVYANYDDCLKTLEAVMGNLGKVDNIELANVIGLCLMKIEARNRKAGKYDGKI